MPLAEEGYLSTPPVALRALVAASARFRTVVGSASEDAAKEHVYLNLGDDEQEEGREDYDPKLKHPRPRAIVTLDDFTRERRGPGEWNFNASLLLSFEFNIPAEYRGKHNDEFVWFDNQVGKILSEMEAARDADTAGAYLPFHRMVMVTNPMPCYEPNHVEPFWGCELVFTWI